MLKRISGWLGEALQPKHRRIACLQVEVSTACQLSCRYCPRTVMANGWRSEIMSWDLYERCLAPHFDLFAMIFLQGWGEPLTNPRFWDMVALAKKAGRQVGFITNALLFGPREIELACELDVDLVCFTFTGATAATHEHYRAGADFTALAGSVAALAARKAAGGRSNPTIGVSYTMIRGNLAELPEAVRLAATLGAGQFTANHLDCIPAPALENDAVFLSPRQDDEALVADAARQAASAGIFFRAEPPTLGGEILVCEANPLHTTLFVKADGTVVPCHQMALPQDIVSSLWFRGAPCGYSPLTLGNAADTPLPEILANRQAQEIFDCFERRAGFSLDRPIPEAPPVCKACYKLYGA
ncbi:radical SAM protein [Anaeroselena agilis]|uniref:Radical SAM protein n=1 Tax=Anaeroselena agilis TaxID=3063788 RepID=A0ABU3NVE5_9FIRM|nr:radical SAM protein [Selenomonadales bacterium 4137-cl]